MINYNFKLFDVVLSELFSKVLKLSSCFFYLTFSVCFTFEVSVFL